MGNLFCMFHGRREMRILMLGLDSSGKTSILYRLKLGELIHTTPSVGFNVARIHLKNMTYSIWEVAGQASIRIAWRFFATKTEGIVYVVDSTDRQRMLEIAAQLHEIIRYRRMRHLAILILAHKQDLPDVMHPEEIKYHLGLHKIRGRKFRVQPSSAVTGEGLLEGLKWLYSHRVKESKKP